MKMTKKIFKGKINKLFLILILFASCSQQTETGNCQETTAIPADMKAHFEFLSSLKLPEKMDFCGEPVPLDIPEVRERAEREFYLLLQQPGQIILYLKRSARYFPMYERIIKENNMPDDLKYLSVAESALYQARSHAGAVGLWQFMKSTARLMGLHVSNYVDERRHPKKSTKAAMKYLKQGYKSLGSWSLTAAGYNMGHGNVRKHLKHQEGDDYFDLYLNSETSRFLFRIAIIKEIMKNAEKYGFIVKDEDRYHPRKVKIIIWNSSIPDLADWAEKHGTSYKNVKLLNPWILKKNLRQPLSGKPYEIAIPE